MGVLGNWIWTVVKGFSQKHTTVSDLVQNLGGGWKELGDPGVVQGNKEANLLP